MTQKNLQAFSLLTIENDITSKLEFNDIIDEFASKKARKKPFKNFFVFLFVILQISGPSFQTFFRRFHENFLFSFLTSRRILIIFRRHCQ